MRYVEVKLNETPQWLSQNLHNAAIMLRTLRSLWKEVYGDVLGFDNKVRVITISVSSHIIEAFAHWTAVDEYAYMHMYYTITRLSPRGLLQPIELKNALQLGQKGRRLH